MKENESDFDAESLQSSKMKVHIIYTSISQQRSILCGDHFWQICT